MPENKNNINNVTTGQPNKAGAIYRAVNPTKLPTSTAEALDTAFVCMGYVSEDGVTNSDTRSSDTVKAWGGDTVLIVESGRDDAFKFKLIEATNVEVLKAIYNTDKVTVDGTSQEIQITASGEPRQTSSWVIDMLLRDGGLKRIVIPDGLITDMGDINYNGKDPIAFDVTLTALVSSAINGATHKEYIKIGSQGE